MKCSISLILFPYNFRNNFLLPDRFVAYQTWVKIKYIWLKVSFMHWIKWFPSASSVHLVESYTESECHWIGHRNVTELVIAQSDLLHHVVYFTVLVWSANPRMQQLNSPIKFGFYSTLVWLKAIQAPVDTVQLLAYYFHYLHLPYIENKDQRKTIFFKGIIFHDFMKMNDEIIDKALLINWTL